MKPATFAVSACAILGATLLAPLAKAQATDPEISALLAKVAAAYQGITIFSAKLELEVNAGPMPQKMTSTFTLKKPKFLVAEVKDGETVNRVVSDGTNVFADTSRDKKQYIKQPAESLEVVVRALAASRGAGVGLLPILLQGKDIEKQIIPGKPTSIKKGPEETIDGVACTVINAILGQGERTATYQFAIGNKDFFLRRLAIIPNTPGAKPQLVETYYNVTSSGSAPETAFKYTPVAGAVAAAPPAEPKMFDPRTKVGAVPLPIAGNDLAGMPVNLAQFKGKVVLVDFWATWCGPCVQELPNVIAAYNKYKAKGFDVLGISLDREGDKPKLQSFITTNKMPWRQIYDGKFWQAANAKTYGVQSIPFTVLIGRDGKIAAVGARGEALAPAIEKALAQK